MATILYITKKRNKPAESLIVKLVNGIVTSVPIDQGHTAFIFEVFGCELHRVELKPNETISSYIIESS